MRGQNFLCHMIPKWKEPQSNSLCLITSAAVSIDCKDRMFKQKPTDDLIVSKQLETFWLF